MDKNRIILYACLALAGVGYFFVYHAWYTGEKEYRAVGHAIYAVVAVLALAFVKVKK